MTRNMSLRQLKKKRDEINDQLSDLYENLCSIDIPEVQRLNGELEATEAWIAEMEKPDDEALK